MKRITAALLTLLALWGTGATVTPAAGAIPECVDVYVYPPDRPPLGVHVCPFGR